MIKIENIIANHPYVRYVAVIALPDEIIGNKILAYVSLITGKDLEAASLLSFCSSLLPKYMIPEKIEFRDSLPMTSSGKIDRKVLAEEAIGKYGR